MTTLIPMTPTEFDAFLDVAIPEYAADNVDAGYWNESEALEKSRNEFERLLPQGVQSENHYLYTINDGDNMVGVIWLRANVDRPTKNGFIFSLRIDEKFRGKGYGKQAMLLIEEKARKLGLKSIGLHVFAVNTVARKLYESVGYDVSSLNMNKKL
ncbi:MAG: GNAT family N-acetyltransferase [Anaerolineales bacterium]|nr:GNAT family N-acetyltransferase [Anaerolineales bacterium]